MEGSRHERAALIAVAYFIGTITAFIGYNSIGKVDLTASAPVQTASVVSAVQSKPTKEDKGIFSYESGVLTVKALDGERVLSFNPETSGYTDSVEFVKQGSHVGDLTFLASPSEEYLFFCEEKSSVANVCSPFIYDVLVDAIYPVTVSGKSISMTVPGARSVSWQNGSISFEGSVSKSDKTPWSLE